MISILSKYNPFKRKNVEIHVTHGDQPSGWLSNQVATWYIHPDSHGDGTSTMFRSRPNRKAMDFPLPCWIVVDSMPLSGSYSMCHQNLEAVVLCCSRNSRNCNSLMILGQNVQSMPTPCTTCVFTSEGGDIMWYHMFSEDKKKCISEIEHDEKKHKWPKFHRKSSSIIFQTIFFLGCMGFQWVPCEFSGSSLETLGNPRTPRLSPHLSCLRHQIFHLRAAQRFGFEPQKSGL